MYVDICKYKRGNKTYKRVLLREGYREGGKVKHRTLANLSHCSDEEIEAIRIAFKMKKNLVELKNLAKGSYRCGKHVGPVAVLYQIANHLGITQALGYSKNALLALWLIMAPSRVDIIMNMVVLLNSASENFGISQFTQDFFCFF